MPFLVLRTEGRDGYSYSRHWIVCCGVAGVGMVIRFLRESQHRCRRQGCMVPRGWRIRACIYMPEYFEELVWPFHLCPVKPLLELADEDFVCGFCLTVCLGVLDETGDVCDFQVAVEFAEALIYKLAAVVSYDGVRYTVTTYDVLPDETLHLVGSYGGKGFYLDPLGKVIDCDK